MTTQYLRGHDHRNGDGEFHIEATVLEDTIWLTQVQIVELFGTRRQAITKHLIHIFQDDELEEKSVSSKMELTAADGKKYLTNFYNLDAILSVGYRVNSKRATQFRRWANQVLKEHLLKGGSVNQRLISHENKLENLDARTTHAGDMDLCRSSFHEQKSHLQQIHC